MNQPKDPRNPLLSDERHHMPREEWERTSRKFGTLPGSGGNLPVEIEEPTQRVIDLRKSKAPRFSWWRVLEISIGLMLGWVLIQGAFIAISAIELQIQRARTEDIVRQHQGRALGSPNGHE